MLWRFWGKGNCAPAALEPPDPLDVDPLLAPLLAPLEEEAAPLEDEETTPEDPPTPEDELPAAPASPPSPAPASCVSLALKHASLNPQIAATMEKADL